MATESNSLSCVREEDCTSMNRLIPGLPDYLARRCLLRIPVDQFGVAASVSKAWKGEIESPEFRLRRKASGFSEVLMVLPRAVRVISGGAANHIFHVLKPHSGHCFTLPPVPGIIPHRRVMPLAIIGSELLVLDHRREQRQHELPNFLHIYNFLSSGWRRSSNMPEGVCISSYFGFSYASDSEGMVYMSGWTENSCVRQLQSSVAYNVKRDMWIPMPGMERVHGGCKGTFEGGKFHVFTPAEGGRKLEIIGTFDPVSWTWEETAVQDTAVPDIINTGTKWEDRNSTISYFCSKLEVIERLMAVVPEPQQPILSSHKLPCWVQDVIGWQDKLILVGKEKHTFVSNPTAIMMDLKTYSWVPVDLPARHASETILFQTGCCSEI